MEPLPVRRNDGTFVLKRDAKEITRAVGVATALGDSSHGMWLKLPWCTDFGAVAAATTLPILLLGGPGGDGSPDLQEQLNDAMSAGANVRGVMMGRQVLFPAEGTPEAAARALFDRVHGGGA